MDESSETDDTLYNHALYATKRMDTAAVIACVFIIGFAVVFYFLACVCFETSGVDYGNADNFVADLLQMQVCSTMQRIEELIIQEIRIRSKLMEPGKENNSCLKTQLEKLEGKIARNLQRLERLRQEIEESGGHDARGSSETLSQDMDASRKALIDKNIDFSSFEILDVHIDVEENVEKGSSHVDDDTMSSRSLHPECAICLKKYSSGDSIAQSKRKKECQHLYHKDCIIRWLCKHDRCPLCQTNILESNKMDILLVPEDV